MKWQADNEAFNLVTAVIDKVLAGEKVNHNQIVPLAVFLQSYTVLPDEKPPEAPDNSEKPEVPTDEE